MSMYCFSLENPSAPSSTTATGTGLVCTAAWPRSPGSVATTTTTTQPGTAGRSAASTSRRGPWTGWTPAPSLTSQWGSSRAAGSPTEGRRTTSTGLSSSRTPPRLHRRRSARTFFSLYSSEHNTINRQYFLYSYGIYIFSYITTLDQY